MIRTILKGYSAQRVLNTRALNFEYVIEIVMYNDWGINRGGSPFYTLNLVL